MKKNAKITKIISSKIIEETKTISFNNTSEDKKGKGKVIKDNSSVKSNINPNEEIKKIIPPKNKEGIICKFPPCTIAATYGFIETNEKEFCTTHKLVDMIKIKNVCIDGCDSKILTYGYGNDLKKIRCIIHKECDMLNLSNIKRCMDKGCKKRAIYNLKDNKYPEWCKEHIKDNMIDVIHTKCLEKDCEKIPSFGYPLRMEPIVCAKHKKDKMIRIVDKVKCFIKECNKTAYFGYPLEGAFISCTDHKSFGMHNLKTEYKKCEFGDCDGNSTYGYENELIKRVCKLHKIDGMKDLKNIKCLKETPNRKEVIDNKKKNKKTCLELECDKTPSYNNVGETIGIYCSVHKMKSMINVKQRKCLEKGCNKKACYNIEGEKRPNFCQEHSTDIMIKYSVNYCTIEGCRKKACYSTPGNKPSLCITHKNNVQNTIKNPRKKCKEKICKEYAIYGNTKATYCEQHRLDNMVNMIEKKCINCSFISELNKDSICCLCDKDSFKDKKLFKQKFIKSFIERESPELWSKIICYDSIIYNPRSGLERPDFLFDFDNYIIILEVDENQHKERITKDESERMENIANNMQKLTIFIRFNPDTYEDHENKIQDPSLEERCKFLFFAIDKIRININTEYLNKKFSSIYLYYNGYNKNIN